jgi:hypothetical protein
MRLVIDTNVLISAALRGGLPGRVLQSVIERDDWQWMAEYACIVTSFAKTSACQERVMMSAVDSFVFRLRAQRSQIFLSSVPPTASTQSFRARITNQRLASMLT